MSSPLLLEHDDALAIITLNNPARANVLDLALAQALAAAVVGLGVLIVVIVTLMV